jgi:hypothetical protein
VYLGPFACVCDTFDLLVFGVSSDGPFKIFVLEHTLRIGYLPSQRNILVSCCDLQECERYILDRHGVQQGRSTSLGKASQVMAVGC